MRLQKAAVLVMAFSAVPLCVAGLILADDFIPGTVEKSASELGFPGASQAVQNADVVAVARFDGVAKEKIVQRVKPGQEGYIPGEPADVYSLLKFVVVNPVKGGASSGDVLKVAVQTGLSVDRRIASGERVDSVIDSRFADFMPKGNTGRPKVQVGSERLLLLTEFQGKDAFFAPSWGLAPVSAGKVLFPSSEQRYAPRTSQDVGVSVPLEEVTSGSGNT